MNKSLTITVNAIKNEHAYAFILPYGVSYEEVYEVLQDIEKDIRQFEKDVAETKEKEAKEPAQAGSDSQVIEPEIVNKGS